MSNVGLNRAVLIGEVERVEYRIGPSGKPRLWFKLHSEEATVDEEGQERVRHAWNSVVVWGKRAEGLRLHIQEGTKLAIEGRLVTSSWEKGGQRRYRTEVHAASVVFLDRHPSAAA